MTCLRHCPCRRAPAVPLGVPREQETAGAFLRRRPGGIVGKQACRGGTYLWLTSDLSAVQTEACGSCGKTRTLRLSRCGGAFLTATAPAASRGSTAVRRSRRRSVRAGYRPGWRAANQIEYLPLRCRRMVTSTINAPAAASAGMSALEGHRVVTCDQPRFLMTQHLPEIDLPQCHERVGGICRGQLKVACSRE